MVYLDSSALVKLVIREPESAALRRYLRTRPIRISSSLAKVEVMRATRAHGGQATTRARRLLRSIDLIAVDDEVIEDASTLDTHVLRSLDAIHLASARALGDELTAVVTYDERMAEAAARQGLAVDAPR